MKPFKDSNISLLHKRLTDDRPSVRPNSEFRIQFENETRKRENKALLLNHNHFISSSIYTTLFHIPTTVSCRQLVDKTDR